MKDREVMRRGVYSNHTNKMMHIVPTAERVCCSFSFREFVARLIFHSFFLLLLL